MGVHHRPMKTRWRTGFELPPMRMAACTRHGMGQRPAISTGMIPRITLGAMSPAFGIRRCN